MSEPATPTYGRGLIAALDKDLFDRAVAFVAPEAWEHARREFHKEPLAVHVPDSMEEARIVADIDALPEAGAVFGIGGGSAIDAAKMYAHRRGGRLVLVPGILSVDAAYTKSIGVRVQHRVRYVGEVFPEALLVDFDLLQTAPKRLNRAGVGDILSIRTALWDWQFARDEKGETYDEAIAVKSAAILERLMAAADDIREVSEDGLRLLSDSFVAEVRLCERFGNSRPEEGSEHYLAYGLEAITRKHYIHGELISYCVLLTSLHQGQPIDDVLRFLKQAGVEFRPEAIGVDRAAMRLSLSVVSEYVRQETQLPWGVFHARPLDSQDADELLDGLEKRI
ncbi:iron-containing alcohol dehydrogenase [bacterium]|nr:iron-containing alcohol dehydrogenase [bacterium]